MKVGADLRHARVPRGADYTVPARFSALAERVFPRTWHLVATLPEVATPGDVLPVTLLPGVLDEPLLIVHGEDGRLRALSNVCTHRAATLVEAPCRPGHLRCPYHGRRFGLDGRLRHAPEFDGTPDFPGPDDHLPEVPVGLWGPFVFVALDPAMPFQEVIAPVRRRADWLPWDDARRDPAGDRAFEVEANWALWSENYLEGFHVPWVHPELARALDWRAYRTELAEWGVVQLGLAPEGGDAMELPEGHPEAGERLAGLYFHLFPLLTLNVYPWGLSVNVVEPLGPARTRIRYQSWVWDEARRGVGAGGALDAVELEDDAIVERVQRGIRSRLYRGGRYAAKWEAGVHHFHRLLMRLDTPPG